MYSPYLLWFILFELFYKTIPAISQNHIMLSPDILSGKSFISNSPSGMSSSVIRSVVTDMAFSSESKVILPKSSSSWTSSLKISGNVGDIISLACKNSLNLSRWNKKSFRFRSILWRMFFELHSQRNVRGWQYHNYSCQRVRIYWLLCIRNH